MPPLSDGQSARSLPSEFPSITVLICTLNEERSIVHVLGMIPSFVTEVLIVDGHSTDRTVEVAREIYPAVCVTTQPGRGKGDAIRHGIQQATGEIVVTVDADGSMDLKDISKFVNFLTQGYDFAKGSRFLPGAGTKDMTRHRLFGNWVFTTLTNILYGTRYTDITYGYNAFWRRSVENIRVLADGFEEVVEWNINIRKKGLKVVEVPSYEHPRLYGEGKLRSFHDGARILRTIIRERFRRVM